MASALQIDAFHMHDKKIHQPKQKHANPINTEESKKANTGQKGACNPNPHLCHFFCLKKICIEENKHKSMDQNQVD